MNSKHLHYSWRLAKAGGRAIGFRVGEVDSVPKTIACRLIEPATA
jgi:hypothetical protein